MNDGVDGCVVLPCVVVADGREVLVESGQGFKRQFCKNVLLKNSFFGSKINESMIQQDTEPRISHDVERGVVVAVIHGGLRNRGHGAGGENAGKEHRVL